MLDTGIDREHPALHGAIAPGVSFLRGAPWDQDPSGHGTAMASLVAARPHPGEDGLEGVAPRARVLPVRVADKDGRALLSHVAAGIVWAVDRGAEVVLLSMGGPVPAPVLDDAVRYAEERGALVVAAAGNVNVNVDLVPAADPRVLSVACTNDAGELAFSTTFAPTTDLTAPGERVLAAFPRGELGLVTGSSASAARMAGAVALVRRLAPDLGPAALRALLLGARGPLPLTAEAPGLARAFPAGPLDAATVLERVRRRAPALAVADLSVLPARARPGDLVRVRARLENRGLVASAPAVAVVRLAGAALARLDAPALAPGESAPLELELIAPPLAAPAALELALENQPALARAALAPADAPARDLALALLVGRTTPEGGLVVEVTVEGRGAAPEGAAVAARLGEVELGLAEVAPLGPGERATLQFAVDAAALGAAPEGVAQLEVRFVGREADDAPHDDAAVLDVELHGALARGEAPLRTQYQQSGDLNVILDAPWRVAPGRAYLPVLLFVPEKGDLEDNTWVQLDRVTIHARTQASAGGANGGRGLLVYDDERGGATHAPVGTVLLDEMGEVAQANGAPDLRVFGHRELRQPGHYTILRLPRGALGAAPASYDADVFVDAEVAWTNRRKFLWVFRQTRQGATHKVMKVRFAAQTRPALPEGGVYYDAHVHTVAEWYQSDSFSLLAPRKAWGGPLPMLKEAAYAIGLVDAPDAVKDRVVTTDHNTYYVDGDTLRDRPLFGPTSVAASGRWSEWERMGEMFGITRGEEVTFSSDNRVNGSFLSLPTGAHALAYKAQHVDGAWHGGSSFTRALGDPWPDLPLRELLIQLAKTNQTLNQDAAVFAAHPFDSGNSWKGEDFEAAFERDPQLRSDVSVLASRRGFLTKGMQLWNGHFGRRSLPKDEISWDDLNPWANQTFAQGNPDWDAGLMRGLGRWHEQLAGLMEYELAADRGTRFPRKVFVSAGSDAHGDFNWTEDRLATIVGFKSTFTVDDSAFGAALTYALPELQPQGAAPAERAFDAMLDGNSVLTDGPLVRFALDAEDRFDGEALQWHDQATQFEDADGRIGGGGDFDGRGTALVRRGGEGARLGYRYASTPEFGDVHTIAIYRTSAGDPNPVVQKPSGAPLLEARGTLAAAGADLELEERLDPAEEGRIEKTTALQLGAYTGDPALLGPDGGRCLTNPVWAVPFDVEATIHHTRVRGGGAGEIPAGELEVVLRFDMSLEAAPYAVELKALDAQGESSDRAVGPIDVLAPVGPNHGWTTGPSGARDSVLTLTNTRPIPLDLDRYGSAPDRVTFVVYFYDAPRDSFGNELNRPAATFEAPGVGTGGGTGPALRRKGSTASTSTAGSGGGGSGGGCALSSVPGEEPAAPAALLVLALAALLTWRRRVG